MTTKVSKQVSIDISTSAHSAPKSVLLSWDRRSKRASITHHVGLSSYAFQARDQGVTLLHATVHERPSRPSAWHSSRDHCCSVCGLRVQKVLLGGLVPKARLAALFLESTPHLPRLQSLTEHRQLLPSVRTTVAKSLLQLSVPEKRLLATAFRAQWLTFLACVPISLGEWRAIKSSFLPWPLPSVESPNSQSSSR